MVMIEHSFHPESALGSQVLKWLWSSAVLEGAQIMLTSIAQAFLSSSATLPAILENIALGFAATGVILLVLHGCRHVLRRIRERRHQAVSEKQGLAL